MLFNRYRQDYYRRLQKFFQAFDLFSLYVCGNSLKNDYFVHAVSVFAQKTDARFPLSDKNEKLRARFERYF